MCNFAAVCSLTLLCGCFYVYTFFTVLSFFYLIWALPKINVIVVVVVIFFCFRKAHNISSLITIRCYEIRAGNIHAVRNIWIQEGHKAAMFGQEVVICRKRTNTEYAKRTTYVV